MTSFRQSLACLILASTSLSAQELAPPASVHGRVDDYLSRCADFGWSGVALLARDGELMFSKGYGFADREAAVGNDADTLFEIASATKPFTACAVMKLVELGRIGLDDPISKHLPGVPLDKRDITVRHLLSHTSGMPRSAVGGSGPDLARAVKGYLSSERNRTSGKRHEYWNGGYALLSGLVEVVAERSYADFCREHIFEAAGMADTGFTGDTLPRERQAVGYNGSRAVRRAAEHAYGSYGYQYRGMGGIVTSAHDLWCFAQALDAGRVLEPETLAVMQTVVMEHQGLGWAVGETTRKTRRIGHGGDVAGFHTQFQRFPDENAVIIVLSNVDEVPVWSLAWNLEALLFGEEPKYAMPPASVRLDPEQLDALVGQYDLRDADGSLVVERDGDALLIGARGQTALERLSGPVVEPRSAPLDLGSLEIESGLEDEAQAARKFLDAVVGKDADWIASQLVDGIPGHWPDMLVTRLWPAHLEKYGALDGVSVLGATRLAPKRTQIVFELAHPGVHSHLRLVLQDRRLNIFALGGPPAASESLGVHATLAQEVMQAVQDKDADFIASILLPGIPDTWPKELVNRIWPSQVEECGALEDVQVIGATRLAPQRVEVLLALSHAHRERGLRIVFQEGRLNIFDLNGPRSALVRRFVPVSKTSFVAFDWLSPAQRGRAEFDVGQGSVTIIPAVGRTMAALIAEKRDRAR